MNSYDNFFLPVDNMEDAKTKLESFKNAVVAALEG